MSTLVENVQKVKNAHAALKTAIAAKGVDVPNGTKLTDMPALVEQIPSAPAQTTAVKFYQDSGRKSLDMQNVVYVDFTKAESLAYCFSNCKSLSQLTLPEGFGMNAKNITFCFSNCNALSSLHLPDGFGHLANNNLGVFNKCSALTSLHLPDGFGQNASSTYGCYTNCTSLTNITGNPNYSVSVNFTAAQNLTHDSLMVIINGLQTVTSKQTLTLGSTNLAKLTEADKKIATDKGWTLA